MVSNVNFAMTGYRSYERCYRSQLDPDIQNFSQHGRQNAKKTLPVLAKLNRNLQYYQVCRSTTFVQNSVSDIRQFGAGGHRMTGLVPRPHRPTLAAPHHQFGSYVRTCRQAKHIGLRAFAEQIGLAAGHLSNIEHARVTPPEEVTIAKIAAVLEIPVGTLLARAGRLGPDDLQRFWQSPLIPSLVMSSTGWAHDEAVMFQETVLASLD